MKDKDLIRQKAFNLRRHLPEAIREQKSGMIGKKLEALHAFQKAEYILFYWAVKEEVKTQPLLEKYFTLKKLYLPQITSSEDFRAILVEDPLKLQAGLKGVPEPLGEEEAKALDIILVPGVAFDQKGHRLGTGKGYYDRFLSRYPKSLKIGLAYEEQMVENLPQDPYDIPMNLVITDQRIYP